MVVFCYVFGVIRWICENYIVIVYFNWNCGLFLVGLC